jgi:hypothetical protein
VQELLTSLYYSVPMQRRLQEYYFAGASPVELLLEVSKQLAAKLSRVKTGERASLQYRLAESLVVAICAATY